MARRGQRPKSPEEKSARARAAGGRRTAAAPDPEVAERGPVEIPPELATPPPWLVGDAREEWLRVVPELARLGLLSTADTGALAVYCSSYGTFMRAEQVIAAADSLTFTTPKGYVMQIPEVSIRSNAARELMAAAEKLGLTPNSRSRVGIEDPEQKDRGRSKKRAEDPALKFFSR